MKLRIGKFQFNAFLIKPSEETANATRQAERFLDELNQTAIKGRQYTSVNIHYVVTEKLPTIKNLDGNMIIPLKKVQ